MFREINPKDLKENVFKLIGDEWTLVSAKKEDGSSNTMTASWGGVGVLWNKPVATIYIRPQRYTFEFIEQSEYFTLSFFDDSYKNQLGFCGKNSGRDCNKAKECGLTLKNVGNSISFDEARLVFLCKKLYYNDINPQNLCDSDIDKYNYENKDYHRMYIGEIVKIYTK